MCIPLLYYFSLTHLTFHLHHVVCKRITLCHLKLKDHHPLFYLGMPLLYLLCYLNAIFIQKNVKRKRDLSICNQTKLKQMKTTNRNEIETAATLCYVCVFFFIFCNGYGNMNKPKSRLK
jgi:hypothetical protein